MAGALVGSFSEYLNQNGGTSVTSFDSSGANLIVVSASYYTGYNPVFTPSDNKGNTWYPLTERKVAGNTGTRLWYAKAANVGSGHTFTWAASNTWVGISVFAFSGAESDPFDVENGASGYGIPLSAGSITPTQDNCIIVSGFAAGDGSISGTPAGMTAVGAAAYVIQTTATAINPSWTRSGGTQGAAASVASFKTPVTYTAPLINRLFSSPGVNGGGGTSGSMNTTGANLLVLSLSYWAGEPTISDSKGNTWIPLTKRQQGSLSHRIWYAITPTVGTGHTFTVAGSNIYPAFFVYAFALHPTNPFNKEAGATATVASLAVGSVTPDYNDCVVLSGVACNATGANPTNSSGLSQLSIPQTNNVCVGGAAGYVVQTTAAAINPTWTHSGTGTLDMAGNVAVFAPAGAAVPPTEVRMSQAAIEVVDAPPTDAYVSQMAVELLSSVNQPARVSHFVVETLESYVATSIEKSNLWID